MPIGMQLLGPILSEETLLKTAWAFEQESGLTNLKALLGTEV